MCLSITVPLIVLLGSVAASEAAIPQQDTRTLVEELLGDDSVRSVEALVALLDEDALLDYIPLILNRIDEVDDFMLDVQRQETRKEAVIAALCRYVRDADISMKRDEVRKQVFAYLKQEYMRHRSTFALTQMGRLFLWDATIEPASDCQELVHFLDSLLMEHDRQERPLKDEEISVIGDILYTYILATSGPHESEQFEKSKQLITRYEKFFHPAFGGRSRQVLREHPIRHMTEAYYKELLTKSPQELFDLVSDDCEYFYYRKDGPLIASLLAGTCERRRENFELLLPCIEESRARWKAENFLTRYCVPPAVDSTPEEKRQTDVVFDILVEQIRNDPVGTNASLLGSFISDSERSRLCDAELDYAYMRERVKAIAEEDGLLPDTVSEGLLDQISRQIAEEESNE